MQTISLHEADALFASASKVDEARALLKSKGTAPLHFCGLAGSAASMLLARLADPKRRGILVANDPEAAGYMYHDLCQILGAEAVAIFPSGYKRDIKYGQPDPPAQILRTETLEAWRSSKQLCWVVTSPEALAEKVPTPEAVEESCLTLKRGERVAMSAVVNRLLELGFRHADYVYEPGQFARRGSILDLFSYSNELPYRIDFFDDEIDSIRVFDIETQLSQRQVEDISVLPSGGAAKSDAGVSLLEFAGVKTPVYTVNPEFMLSRIREIASESLSLSTIVAEEGDPEAMTQVVNPDSIEDTLKKMRVVRISAAREAAPLGAAGRAAEKCIDFNCTPQTIYHKNFDLIAESFTDYLRQGYRILILADAAHQPERLRSVFADRGDDITFTAVSHTLHEGFTDHDAKVCFFTDHQIFDRFHKYSLKSDRTRNGKLALSLKELQQIETGDYIVHIDHGIGRFGGLIKTDVNGRPQEMIKLFYQNDDIILVSIHALHKLSKYRAKEGVPPKINKLGTGAWQRIKDKTKAKVKDIARDLIRLYAARREEKGYAYSPDTYMQHELEAGFQYEDTPDQLKATEAIKKDMESAQPMDRLICGDVGFGKTELAVRAAFKAAADNKQTAVLVPTTVLAMQHYQTFKRRLEGMPVRVEMLSRARKPKEVKQILADLKEGKIDILIGTHKIIGKGVEFHDLGLLIVDEEQKFGVAVKEKLKQLKVNVDTLTMSATPIPRTLQFSLMGARDLSSLNTPPSNRRAVSTSVSTFDDDIIREAINFELSRNGQVFFISPRIARLEEIEAHLRELIPGLRVVMIHGQMPPEEVEKRILDFGVGDYDILLSTTIVENGIDMPNVNTILIDNAQHFGLSELHQLRGRVGRSSRKAFCYLLVPPGKPLTPEARRRLQAIESFSDLGSGIHIAMQDLDIRGAGNLLGAEQSGFIADLGYETYQKILRESVMELKTEEFGDTFTDLSAGKEEEYVSDCVIESDLELRFPPQYVPQESERISLYQQLDNMREPAQIEAFRAQLRDRFGNIPLVSSELINVVPLRAAAVRLGIERLTLKGGKMYLYFVGEENVAYYQSAAFGRVLGYLQSDPLRAQLRDRNGRKSFVFYDVPTVSEALRILTDILATNPV